MDIRCLDSEGMRQQIFLELLRSYNNGVGITHPAQPIEELAIALGREATELNRGYWRSELVARPREE